MAKKDKEMTLEDLDKIVGGNTMAFDGVEKIGKY